jgi:hypothetical protein
MTATVVPHQESDEEEENNEETPEGDQTEEEEMLADYPDDTEVRFLTPILFWVFFNFDRIWSWFIYEYPLLLH